MKYLVKFNEKWCGCFGINSKWLKSVENITGIPLTEIENILEYYLDDYDIHLTDFHWRTAHKDIPGLYYRVILDDKINETNHIEIQIISNSDKFTSKFKEISETLKVTFENGLRNYPLEYEEFNYSDDESGNNLYRLLIFKGKSVNENLLPGQHEYLELKEFLQDIYDEEFDVQINNITEPAHLPNISIQVYFENKYQNDFNQAIRLLDRNTLLHNLIKDFLQRVQNTNQYIIDKMKLMGPTYGYWIQLKSKDNAIAR